MINQRLSVPTEGFLPQDGDIVLTPQSRPGVGWNLSRYGGPAEVSTKAREDAIGVASGVASEFAVDVWSLENGTYRSVEVQRPAPRDISR